MTQIPPSAIARFLSKFEFELNTGCHLWSDHCSSDGYGQFFIRHGVPIAAHRASWIIHFGEIRDGLFVLHRCDTKPCINPDHLFLGRQLHNMRDMADKGRARNGCLFGADHGSAKLTDDDIRAIRALYAGGRISQAKVGERFGVHQSWVSEIVNGRKWKHIQ